MAMSVVVLMPVRAAASGKGGVAVVVQVVVFGQGTVLAAVAFEHGTFLLPRSDYQIERNWDVLGLRGTGSHDIVVEDAFVPAHRVQRTNNWTLEATPGRLVNTNPIYAIPFAQVFSRAVSTSAIGALQGAINEFRENAATRSEFLSLIK